MKLSIDQARVSDELNELASFSDAPAPAVTRIAFSETDLHARAWFKERCAQAGLRLREDPVGNTFARWIGLEPDLPAIGTGSHIDAIPNSGCYDGTVGVIGGLEAIRALQDAGFRPRRSIELLLFTSEEPTRFGIGCLGSRLLSGNLVAERADALTDQSGKSLAIIRSNAGFNGRLDSVELPPGYYGAFVELHIEQGPILERDLVGLGVVTHIAAPAAARIRIDGEGGHAGAVLMPFRHDAFLAAAEIALAAEAAALATGSIDTVATTGVCTIFPSAVNSIPSRATLELDVRDTDEVRRDSVLREIARACNDIQEKRGVRISTEVLNADPPAVCDAQVVNALRESCRAQNHKFLLMVSRAYHDSLFMSQICPTGMLFIPCRNGVSHRPDEYASPEAIATGIGVLAETLARLADGSHE